VNVLQAALSTHNVAAAAASLAPPLPQYQALRRELARYRSLSDTTDGPSPPGAAALRPGDSFAGIDTLRRRLAAFGDLPADTVPAAGADVYDDALAAGVRRFQARHGLAPDGVLGRATLAALAVPVRARIRQIELALERLAMAA
jgi:murein L,D-transpeptidase YcbB/YkuD